MNRDRSHITVWERSTKMYVLKIYLFFVNVMKF